MPLPPVHTDAALFNRWRSTTRPSCPVILAELQSRPEARWSGRLVGAVAELADSPNATYWRERLAVSVRFKAAQGLVPGLVDGNPL